MTGAAIPNAGPVGTALRWRQLILQLARREVEGRYRGSLLGLAWAVAQPLLYLAVFTFVFGSVFEARWGVATGPRAPFGLTLFAGLIVYWHFSEAVSRAPGLVLAHASLVKRVLFPVEVLPMAAVLAASFHTALALTVWLAGHLVFVGLPPWTFVLAPVVLAPVALMALAISYVVAGVGVYARDIGQLVTVGLTVLMFLSPIFYPLEAVPAAYRQYFFLNPLTAAVEEMRGVLLDGRLPGLMTLAGLVVGGLAVVAAFAIFRRLRRGFADVL
ncbi:lipopolysaccharide transport system permease protein [Stella humosa]|uniref:Transport permease protein n=1 Tax=Stella humosa TaxID=94 RepID=A0A3N1KSR6_9PROT|nr:ABC transporter permease [Stella humosa]ROP83054.1 lipopolysaccharide transport system permease protein [Stella humosa]BBK30173.1 transport permease protein [Stella humosa]